ncbi:DUF1295-domain-containing protein [Tothia fuscella]|uniref:DUF1295-domain-containing protein n=1 Tax=Tothia fuscella TaxID=1048955 RepID=A0A9P4NUU4_9PEZI|nr:DUF1295-domain-containing protein [Tothia fuscella]
MATIISLPVLKVAQDCADFSLTVRPYIPQLLELPNKIAAIASSTNGFEEFGTLYLNTNPLVFGFAISLLLAPIFLIVSEINKNYSQVDRMWSILPTLYIGHYTLWAHKNNLPTQRLDNVLAFAAIWTIRLTFNYWRKGGYSIGSEDYRWLIVKDKVGPVVMFLFNVTFIATIQSVLLWLITTPAYLLLLRSRQGVGAEKMDLGDIIFARVLMGLVLIEFFADQQQWDYQNAKKAYQKDARIPSDSKYTAEDLDRGFVVNGLWSWSRHPNFAAEQAIWVILYQWGCYATNTLFNWTFAGALSYLLLFQGSTWLTELITAKKYPEYKEYQRLVGRFLPKLLSPSTTDAVERKIDGAKATWEEKVGSKVDKKKQ